MTLSSARLNVGMLDGLLQITATGYLALEAWRVPAALGTVQTDAPENGGRHGVLFTGALAMRVAAYWQARGAEPQLEVTVHGWLRSLPDTPSVLVAQQLRVHNTPEVPPLTDSAPAFRQPLTLAP